MVEISLASPAKCLILEEGGGDRSPAVGLPRRDKLITEYPFKAARLHTACPRNPVLSRVCVGWLVRYDTV